MNLRRHTISAVSLATMLALAGCSGGGSLVDQLASASSSAQAAAGFGGSSGADALGDTSVAASTDPAVPTVLKVDKSVEFAGMTITVETATLQPATQQFEPTTVTLGMVFHNLGDSSGVLSDLGSMDLASGSNHYTIDGNTELPLVPGGAQSHGTATFAVTDAFSLDNAVLTFGAGSTVQSVMPLGATGTLVANLPEKVALSGTVSSGTMSVTVTGGELRTDLPKAFTQSDADTRFLLVGFDVTNLSKREHPYGDLVTGGSQFTLTEPNGDTVMPYDLDDFYGGAASTTVAPGGTGHNLLLTFVIDAPVSGDYTLQLTGPQDNNEPDDAPTATLPLVLS